MIWDHNGKISAHLEPKARILMAATRAFQQGHDEVGVEDVEAVVTAVLAHRILTNFHAESEGITSREIIRRLVEACRET